MKFSVIQLRVLIIVVNLVLTLAVGGHAAYRFMNPNYAAEDGKKNRTLQALLRINGEREFGLRKAEASRSNEVMKVNGIGNALDPALPPPEEAVASDANAQAEEAAAAEGAVEEGGPLDDAWEYVTPLIFAPGSPQNRAVLRMKSASPRRITRRPTTRRAGTAARARNTRTARNRRVTRRSTAQSHKTLQVFEKWVVDEDKGPTVWVVNVTPEEFIYEVEGTWRQYALRRAEREIYIMNENGDIEGIHPPKEEGEDEAEDTEEAEKEKKFFVIGGELPSPRSEYDNRKAEPSSMSSEPEAPKGKVQGTRRSDGRTSPTRSIRAATRQSPKSKAQQLREFKSSWSQMKDKIPQKDRKKIEDALKKKTVK